MIRERIGEPPAILSSRPPEPDEVRAKRVAPLLCGLSRIFWRREMGVTHIAV